MADLGLPKCPGTGPNSAGRVRRAARGHERPCRRWRDDRAVQQPPYGADGRSSSSRTARNGGISISTPQAVPCPLAPTRRRVRRATRGCLASPPTCRAPTAVWWSPGRRGSDAPRDRGRWPRNWSSAPVPATTHFGRYCQSPATRCWPSPGRRSHPSRSLPSTSARANARVRSNRVGRSRSTATYISVPEAGRVSDENGLTAFGLYSRRQPRFVAPAGSLPPLIVASHGGPTGNCSSVLDYEIQFWTSRGFAVTRRRLRREHRLRPRLPRAAERPGRHRRRRRLRCRCAAPRGHRCCRSAPSLHPWRQRGRLRGAVRDGLP